MPPHPQSILDKNKDLGNYDEYLPLRDCFFAGLLIRGLTKEKYNTTLMRNLQGKDSFLHCFTWTSRLHLFSRLCPTLAGDWPQPIFSEPIFSGRTDFHWVSLFGASRLLKIGHNLEKR